MSYTEIKSSNTFYRTHLVYAHYAHIEQNGLNSSASHPAVISCTFFDWQRINKQTIYPYYRSKEI